MVAQRLGVGAMGCKNPSLESTTQRKTGSLGPTGGVMRTCRSSLLTVALTFVFTLAFSTIALAQSGVISGTVSDTSGAVIPSAKVQIRDVQTDATRSAQTNAQGFYEFLAVRPSTYEVTIEAKGFGKAIKHDMNVVVGLVSHLDVSLQPGSVSETVEVKTEVALIEPEKTNVSYSISTAQIQNLPLQGRQFLDLALLTPGVTPQAPGTQAGGLNVAGMRSQSNNFTLDGISINDPQVNGPLNNFRIADAVQEFNVNTSIANADLGRSSGAQVAVVTKSGSNAYHGSLFYYGRNEALDANDWFLNRAGKPKNELRRHQFGGTAGGWIVRDKTFWFASVEVFRQINPSPDTALVPTLAMRSQVTDPVSLKLLQFIPAPNALLPGANWVGTTDQHNNNETYLLRVDHNLTQSNHLMGRYVLVRGESLQEQTNPFNGSITNTPGSQSVVAEDTFNHSNWINVFRLGFTRNLTKFGPQDVVINPASIFTNASGAPLPGYVNTTVSARNGGLPRITISDPNLSNFGLGSGTNMPQGRTTNTYQLIDNVSFVHAKHTLQFGGEIRRELSYRFLNGNFRGAISFPSWARFATGQPQAGTLRTGGPDETFRTWTRQAYYLYIQDSWKARSNLTLNYGVRYELPGAMVEKNDTGSNFVPGIGMMKLGSNLRIDVNPTVVGPSAVTLTPVNVFLPSSGQFNNATKNFAPFLGVAWSPKTLPAIFGDGETVIRTGFRLGYDDTFANIPVNMGLNYPPVVQTTLPTATYTWANVLSQNRLFVTSDPTVPAPGRGILGFNAWDTSGKSAYAMNYALEIERQLGKDYAVQASYIGTQGRKLGVFLDSNQPLVNVVNPALRGTQSPNTRSFPFPFYAGISLGTFASNSNYNGMVLTFKKRPSHGLLLQTSYTLGKSLDNNSSFFGSDGEAGAFADTRHPELDYGPSAFDVRHQFIFSYLYDLPFGRGRTFINTDNRLLDYVVGGWSIGGITNWHTGFPFTIRASTSTDFSGFNQFADRPIFTGTGSVATDMSNPDKAFDTSVFKAPAAGNIGNVGRNSLYGPHYADFDLSLQKSFSITEKKKFQFRADVFNLFNHPNFNLPNSNLSFSSTGAISATAGKITSDNNANPRLIQLGLRMDW
ncbi:MAG: hypothetical protein DMG65_07745 [Candidatus Angelobacter sp. Gp1-AA117]|nr:MAG: hypothetical protein DMG65_07745 [Candidatus Angelobacter sp. Gp1-AA117]